MSLIASADADRLLCDILPHHRSARGNPRPGDRRGLPDPRACRARGLRPLSIRQRHGSSSWRCWRAPGWCCALRWARRFAIHVLAGDKADPRSRCCASRALALIATFVAVACGFPLLTLRRYRPVLYINLGALVFSGVAHPGAGSALERAAPPSRPRRRDRAGRGRGDRLVRSEPLIRLSVRRHPGGGAGRGVGAASGLILPIHPLLGVLVASLVYFLVLRLLGRFPHEVREVMAGQIGRAIDDKAFARCRRDAAPRSGR